MKKLAIAALLMGAMAVPFAAGADDIPDGQACADDAGNTGVHLGVLSADDPTTYPVEDLDRGAVCVNDGETVILYVGGEAVAEEEPGDETGVACGAVIVNGETLAGEANWDDPEEGTHCD